jgi:hypothetical protein
VLRPHANRSVDDLCQRWETALRAAPRLPVAATWGHAHQLLVPAVVHRIVATFVPAQTAPRQQKDDAATGQNSLVVSA